MTILEHRPSGRHRISFSFKRNEVLATTKYKPNYILWDLQLNKYVDFKVNYNIIITKETLFASVIKTILYSIYNSGTYSYNLVFNNKQFLFYSGVVLELYVNDYETTPIRITSVKAVIMYEKGKNVYINKNYRDTSILKAIFKYCQPLDDVNEIYPCLDEIKTSNFYLCSSNRLNITQLQKLKENIIGSDDRYLLTLEPVLQSNAVKETLETIALLNEVAGTVDEINIEIDNLSNDSPSLNGTNFTINMSELMSNQLPDIVEINSFVSDFRNVVSTSVVTESFNLRNRVINNEIEETENITIENEIEEEVIEYVETTTYNQIVSTDNTVIRPVRIYDLQSFSNLMNQIPTHD